MLRVLRIVICVRAPHIPWHSHAASQGYVCLTFYGDDAVTMQDFMSQEDIAEVARFIQAWVCRIAQLTVYAAASC